MAIIGKYVNEADCQAKLSAEVWQRILDDDANGTADEAPGQLLVDDAESFVESKLGGAYPLAVLRAQGRLAVAHEVRRLVLEVLKAFAVERHPAYIRADWVAILGQARVDLKELRGRIAQLDTVTAPEPGIYDTGMVAQSGDQDSPEPADATFLGVGKMGDFA